MKNGQVGVFITVEDTEAGKLLVDKCHSEAETIEKEVGLPVAYIENPKRRRPEFSVSESLDIQSDDLERQQGDWLKRVSNRMVNAFRPRVEQIGKA